METLSPKAKSSYGYLMWERKVETLPKGGLYDRRPFIIILLPLLVVLMLFLLLWPKVASRLKTFLECSYCGYGPASIEFDPDSPGLGHLFHSQ